MNFKSLFSLAAIVVSTCDCIAQNELLIMKPGDSIPGVLTVTDAKPWYERYDYRVAQPSPKLAAAVPLKVDFVKAASLSLNSFQFTMGGYGKAAPGCVIFGWVNSGFNGAVQPENDNTPVRESMKKVLSGSREVRDMIYAWLMPYYQKAFSVMSINEQNDMIAALRNSQEFVTKLEIESEKKTVKKTPGYADKVGRLNAFIYRRVANAELSKEECIEWLNKIIKDLSAVQNKNPDPEDNYVLRAEHGYGYYTASVYNFKDNYGRTFIMRKQNGKYELVPGAGFDELNQCGKNLLIGVRSNYPDPATYGYLYYDSTNSIYRETATGIPSTGVVMKGSAENPCALLFYSPDIYEYVEFDSAIGDAIGKLGKIGVCCLLEIKTGKVIQDSMYIPLVEKKLNDWGDVEYTYPAASADYMVFSDGAYGLRGMMDGNGNIILAPQYESIEATENPNIFLLNGNENFDVRSVKAK
jgi:hypothetical protein